MAKLFMLIYCKVLKHESTQKGWSSMSDCYRKGQAEYIYVYIYSIHLCPYILYSMVIFVSATKKYVLGTQISVINFVLGKARGICKWVGLSVCDSVL